MSRCLTVLLLGVAASTFAAEPGATAVHSIAKGVVPRTDPAHNDVLYPVMVNNWWGLMNQLGHLIVPLDYDWTDYSYEGIVRVVADGKTYFLLGNGEPFFDQPFTYADRFAEGFAIVGDGEHFGFINKRGKLVVPLKLDGALRFSEGLAAVMVNGRCGFINVTGELVIPMRYEQVRSFSDGLAAVRLPPGPDRPAVVGYVNRNGNWAVRDDAGRFDELDRFSDGMARVRVGDRWGYIDRSMKLAIEPAYEDARDFVNGSAAVKIDGRWGYINKRGRVVVEPRFDLADDFDQTMAMVALENKYGFINRTGSAKIEPRYDMAQPFFRDYARVLTGNGWGYIGITGRFIWDPRHAQRGFVDIRFKRTARILVDSHNRPIHHGVTPPPALRPPVPAPYPPEHQYEPVLPRPTPADDRKSP